MSTRLPRSLLIACCCAIIAACRPDAVPPIVPPPASPDLVVRQIEIVTPAAALVAGMSLQLAAIARNGAGDTLTGVPLTWYSNAPGIATISKAGMLTTVRAGSVAIVVDAGTAIGATELDIGGSTPADTVHTPSPPPPPPSPPSAGIARIVVSGSTTLALGTTVRFTAIAYATGNVPMPGVPFVWTSSNGNVASVGINGTVQTQGTGTAVISAVAGGIAGSVTVTVYATMLAIGPILDMQTGWWNFDATVVPGQRYRPAIRALQANGIAITPLPAITWLSDHPEIASVDTSGLIQAQSAGTAQITAHAGSSTVGYDFHVVPTIAGYATVRFVHATSDASRLTIGTFDKALTTLSYSESSEQTLAAGVIQLQLAGVLTGQGSQPGANGGVDAPLAAHQHYTVYAAGSAQYGVSLMAVLDRHDPVPPDQGLVRIVMAGTYAANYFGNNIYFLDPGAPLAPSSIVACYFDGPTFTSYGSRTPQPFDLVVADAGFYNALTQTTIPDVEAARFTVNLVPGHAMTYVITGSTKASLRVLTFVDR